MALDDVVTIVLRLAFFIVHYVAYSSSLERNDQMEPTMKIKAYASGYYDGTKLTDNAACAVNLTVTKDDVTLYRREIAYLVTVESGTTADLLAARLAVSSIKLEYRDFPIELWVTAFPAKMLEREGENWKSKPSKNERLIDKLRTTVLQYTDVTVISRQNVELTRAWRSAIAVVTDRRDQDVTSRD